MEMKSASITLRLLTRVRPLLLKVCLIPIIKNKVINYRDLLGIFRPSFLVNIQNINFEKMVKISQIFYAKL